MATLRSILEPRGFEPRTLPVRSTDQLREDLAAASRHNSSNVPRLADAVLRMVRGKRRVLSPRPRLQMSPAELLFLQRIIPERMVVRRKPEVDEFREMMDANPVKVWRYSLGEGSDWLYQISMGHHRTVVSIERGFESIPVEVKREYGIAPRNSFAIGRGDILTALLQDRPVEGDPEQMVFILRVGRAEGSISSNLVTRLAGVDDSVIYALADLLLYRGAGEVLL